MSVTSGFFDSQLTDTGNPDRLYNAEDMSRIFDGVITDGVYKTIGTNVNGGIMPFYVSPVSGKFRINVNVGRAWFDHTWTYNDAPIMLPSGSEEAIELPQTLPRIDSIVLEVNHENGVRNNSIKLITGTPASNPVPPTLLKTATVKQYRLANLNLPSRDSIAPEQKSIAPTWIDNTVIGTAETPFVTNLLEHLDLTAEKQAALDKYNEWLGNYPFLRVVEK